MKKLICLLMLVCCMGFFAGNGQSAELGNKENGCYLTNNNNREVMLEKYIEGEKAFNNDQYSKALTLLKPAAEAGNPNAQYLLGLMYDFGNGVPTDHVKANEWYLKAAQQGQDDAQYNLAVSYMIGEGIEKNMLMSICWVAKAAANGDEDGLKLLTHYAEQNIPEAQYALSQVYRNGVNLHNNDELYPHEGDNTVVRPDKTKADSWLNKAKANGYR